MWLGIIVNLVPGLEVTSVSRVLFGPSRKQRTRVNVNVRRVDVGRVGVCMMCVCDSEECVYGVGHSHCEYYCIVRNTLGRRTHRNYHHGVSVVKKNHELVCIR